jgi:hypothetical protein
VYTGTQLKDLSRVTNGAPSCVFVPISGQTYVIGADPLARGTDIVLDVASSDWLITAPETNGVQIAPSTVAIQAAGGDYPNITNVQYYANNVFLKEVAPPDVSITNEFLAPGFFDLRVAATDDRGIRTLSSARRIMVRPEGGVFDAQASIHRIIDGSYTIVFKSPVQTPVMFDYSDDLITWRPANDTVMGTGGQLVWFDQGPPKTDRDPRIVPRRYYRLRFGF